MAAGENPAVVLLGEPFTMPVDAFVRRFNEDYPGIPVIGGMASRGTSPGENLLVSDGAIRETGAVGVLLSGALVVRALVSQGCRPIGRRYVVTDCDRNTVKALGGRPALKVIRDMFGEISPEERGLFQAAPHVGIVMDEQKRSFGPGDFLIRNLLGVDPARGAVFISDHVRRGQTVQFHVFCCNGRGQRLFERPDHDISALRKSYGPIPLAGFFAQGEVGPVGRRNHLHGFTTCVALFCEP
jgi:small ligand-binding sensory domain FIST